MKEYQRQIAISQITRDIEEKELIKDKQNELEQLRQNPVVAKYLQLLEEINSLKKKYKYCDSKEKIINNGFRTAIEDFKCHHEIWIYEGSYYLSIDIFRHEHDYLIRKSSEYCETRDDFVFKYNKYVCLECDKTLETADWQNFENSHYVLKNQIEEYYIDINHYRNLFYQLLYIGSIKNAQQTVIEQFNIDKEKE